MSDKTTETDTTTAIDAAIAKAQARKKAKKIVAAGAEQASETASEPAKGKRVKLTDAEREARKVAQDQERADRKAARELKRAEKIAERTANKSPAHMKKVLKAAAGLPTMTESANRIFDEVTCNYGTSDIAALAMHLQHFNRMKATERALTQKLTAGATVRILAPGKFNGMTGTVAKAQRIRAYIDVQGVKKPIYVFTSDVEIVSEQAATGTNG